MPCCSPTPHCLPSSSSAQVIPHSVCAQPHSVHMLRSRIPSQLQYLSAIASGIISDLPSQKSSSACCFAACAVQKACARVTLSSSSCGTGSPLRWCGAMRAVCTNVFHLSCHTQHHAMLLRHPNHNILVHQPHGSASTSNLATPAPFHHLTHPAPPYLQVDICPMLRVFKRPQFHITPPVSQPT